MSEWKTYTLGKDVVTKLGDGLHGTPIYNDNGEYYFINGSNLVDGKIVINSNTKKVTEEEFVKYKKDLSDKTILLGINGTIGNVALYNNEMCILGKSAAYLNINDDFDRHFVKYVLTNDHFQNYIKNNASGTTIKNVGLGLLREYQFSAPEAKEQQQEIAQILTSLDDKIELNLQMNQTLEAMAQALFKEWFVNFNFPNFDGELENDLPKGWRMGSLSEIMYVQNGYAFKSNDFIDEGENGILKIKNISNKVVDIVNMQFIPSEVAMNIDKRFKVESGDFLIAMTGAEVGKVGMVPNTEKNLWLNQRVGSFKEKVKYSKWFCYLILSTNEYQNILLSSASGSAQPNISGSQIERTEIILPSVDLIEEFGSIVNSLFEKILENYSFNQSLTQTRDTLLPKLMTGKIEISN